MAYRTLIVARMEPGKADAIARIFEESDAGELPLMAGVSHRTLYSFHDLYFHLAETEGELTPELYHARSHPLVDDLNTRLNQCLSPYDPHWKEPKDALAEPFYVWSKGEGRIK
ncbi:TcmI family type II polyketide cyclase [Streptomyces sp. NPDC048172]|uniref:TcmI family type II polyketide cyclase n=1 Tax=Streptomyces sp. NPDC048172 TaxID=3365505 RepID=UPI00372239B8